MKPTDLTNSRVLTLGELDRAEGRVQGRAEGMVAVLLKQFQVCFGPKGASAAETALKTLKSEAALLEVSAWVHSCRSGEELLAKVEEIQARARLSCAG